MMKGDSALTAAAAASAAHHQLLTSHHHHKLNEVKSGPTDKSGSSVKAEPLDQMSLYSSHFATATEPSHYPLTQHDPSVLTGLPHLTPAPYSTVAPPHHQGFSIGMIVLSARGRL